MTAAAADRHLSPVVDELDAIGYVAIPKSEYTELLARPAVKSAGLAAVAAKRRRQIEVHGWTPEHDAEHDAGELSEAARSYLSYAICQFDGSNFGEEPPPGWPWDASWWRPDVDPAENLVTAAALIVAEIDAWNRRGDEKR